ncbi:hypothetical protein ACU6T4_08345 [Avibacterium paragallinarum]|nr:hypothetical protein [Avibacterium paragallinarum]
MITVCYKTARNDLQREPNDKACLLLTVASLNNHSRPFKTAFLATRF